jgi:glycosyltransferase involved in cell wall biosynthesis
MQLEVLRQHAPQPIHWDRIPAITLPEHALPHIAVVTPSYNQAGYLPLTMESVLSQGYPRLRYAVQDGASTDGSAQWLGRYAPRLAHAESVSDRGQADAIARGFSHLLGKLAPADVMAWLNSDDLYSPGALRRVGEYFAANPDVDAVYGHRIVIDEAGYEVGRWVLPPHDPDALTWVDYVPQETLFWRKRAWDAVGGLDLSFQFALDWDLLARFTAAGLRLVRLPYFTACFRVHAAQKTSLQIHSTGADEMTRIRSRFHGAEGAADWKLIQAWASRERRRGAFTARMLDWGIRL